MSEETNHTEQRQQPAPDTNRCQHKTGKRKVWRFKSEWLPEKTFTTKTKVDGKWVKESFTLQEMRESDRFYYAKLGPPIPYHKFKTLEDALTSWRAMVHKKEVPEKAKYWLENTDSGEIVDLSHIT